MDSSTLFWRRTDIDALERLVLVTGPDRVTAESTIVSCEPGGFRLDHCWELGPDWRARRVTLERWSPTGHASRRIERAPGGWCVDGARRPDLDGADDLDLSATPFCNSFAIHRVPPEAGAVLTLDTVFVDAPALGVARSRQRYVSQGPRAFRYTDLGLSAGFATDLLVDAQGLVLRYEHLFERVSAG